MVLLVERENLSRGGYEREYFDVIIPISYKIATIYNSQVFMVFDLSESPEEADELATRYAKRTKQEARAHAQEHLAGMWEGKTLHGKHPRRMKDADVDLQRTRQWLTSSGLKRRLTG